MKRQAVGRDSAPSKPERGSGISFVSICISVLSLCVALTSLLISYKNYQHSQTEKLSVTIFPSSSNSSASMVRLSGNAYLFVFWDVLFTNTGDRPLTIVRYAIREHLPNGRFQNDIPASFYDAEDHEILLPITLQPAESRLVRVELPLRPARSALAILDEELDSDASWDEIVRALFWRDIDIYGNKYKLVQLPGEELWVNMLEPPLTQQRFEFTFTTGRDEDFSSMASLYGQAPRRIIGREK